MKTLIRLEELSMFGLALYFFLTLDVAWWWFPILILAPDLSMVGYLINPRVGAVAYNLIHHKAVGIAVFILGAITGNTIFQIAGLILFAHSSMDRIFGYGLKYPDAFQHTHLGWIGKEGATP